MSVTTYSEVWPVAGSLDGIMRALGDAYGEVEDLVLELEKRHEELNGPPFKGPVPSLETIGTVWSCQHGLRMEIENLTDHADRLGRVLGDLDSMRLNALAWERKLARDA